MRTIAVSLSLIVLTVSLCLAAGTVNINSVQANSMLAKNRKIVLLDVRTPDEYRQAHLSGSLLIPLGDLAGRLKEIPRDRPVLIYCAVGSRSNVAANILLSNGYREVYNMVDGVVGWYKNGLPLQFGAR